MVGKHFRVWCSHKEQWETEQWYMNADGDLVTLNTAFGAVMKLNPKTHIRHDWSRRFDVKGNRIFEGDLVKSCNGPIVLIERKPSGLMPMRFKGDGKKGRYSWEYVEKGEIIGNVLENKDFCLLNRCCIKCAEFKTCDIDNAWYMQCLYGYRKVGKNE